MIKSLSCTFIHDSLIQFIQQHLHYNDLRIANNHSGSEVVGAKDKDFTTYGSYDSLGDCEHMYVSNALPSNTGGLLTLDCNMSLLL